MLNPLNFLNVTGSFTVPHSPQVQFSSSVTFLNWVDSFHPWLSWLGHTWDISYTYMSQVTVFTQNQHFWAQTSENNSDKRHLPFVTFALVGWPNEPRWIQLSGIMFLKIALSIETLAIHDTKWETWASPVDQHFPTLKGCLSSGRCPCFLWILPSTSTQPIALGVDSMQGPACLCLLLADSCSLWCSWHRPGSVRRDLELSGRLRKTI